MPLWGKCDQAIHYSIDCYVTKALLQITSHRGHSYMAYVAKMRFVTLLSTEVLNSLEKLSWLQRLGYILPPSCEMEVLT